MVVYLHCEVTARDLDSRLLIAAHLLNAGEPVVVGQIWSILANLEHSPRGVSVFATANKFQAHWIRQCAGAGRPVIVTNEEALAIQSRDTLVRCVHPDSVIQEALFLVHNVVQESFLREAHPSIATRVTGNARIDLCRQHTYLYEAETAECRQAGKYVLFNTGFTMVNSVWGSGQKVVDITLNSIDPKDTWAIEELRGDIQHQTANFRTVMQLLERIKQKLPKHRIVVRPHPAENAETWRAIEGVEIVSGSNALPWMLGADLVIHTCSTTGLESVLMGVPCINVGEKNDLYVLDRVNCSIPDPEKAMDAIVSFVKEKKGPIRAYKPPLDSYVANGAKHITDEILKVAATLPTASPIDSWGQVPGTETTRRKFNVPLDLFVAKVTTLCSRLVAKRIDIKPLDDSLFLLTP